MPQVTVTTRTPRQRRWLLVGTLCLLVLLLAEPMLAIRRVASGALAPVGFLPLLTNERIFTQPSLPTTTPTATSTATPTATAVPLPCSYAYPIGVNARLLDANGFLPPTNPGELQYYGLYSDGFYSNKPQRRLYDVPPPDFVFFTWKGSTGAITLSAALTGTGTLDQGFDEVVPWPDPNSLSPSGYPLRPHQLSPGDWLSVASGGTSGPLIVAALTQHVIRRSVLALPIYDQLVGTGTAAFAHVSRMGAFLLNGFYLGAPGSYLDLVYLGPAETSLCSSAITPTPLPPSSVTPSVATMTPTPTASPTSSPTSTPTPSNTPTPTFNGTIVPAALSLLITNFYFASSVNPIRSFSVRALVTRDGQAFDGASVSGTIVRGSSVIPVTLASIGGGVYIGCNLGNLTGTGFTPAVSLSASDGQGNTANASSSTASSTKFADCP